MRHFTKSNTFDVNYLFENHNNSKNNHHEHKRGIENEAMFDVKELFEK